MGKQTSGALTGLLLCLAFCTALCSQVDTEKLAWIERFAPLAVEDMAAYGIPASIKLAQSIVESNWGRSRLAREANNYFGIKCKSWWDGETIALEDDDRDAEGRLVPSCFRKYDSPEASFRDHTWFLLQDRYQQLFRLDILDYRGWAEGLQRMGYATNPHYAELLIRTIETYDLQRYDMQVRTSRRAPEEAANVPATSAPSLAVVQPIPAREVAVAPAPARQCWYDPRAIKAEVPLLEGDAILP